MTVQTTFLNLITYSSEPADQSGSFITWTQDMSGSVNSNMTKIDAWSGSVTGSYTGLSGSISASYIATTGSMNNISGSITTINANILTLQSRFAKLYEFVGSGSGFVDFDNIPQTYKHLLILGVACSNRSLYNMDVGVDFNGDANSSNYEAIQWNRSGTPNFEHITTYTTAQIIIANVPGCMSGINIGGPFIAIIPNYSEATYGFYKTAMGMSMYTFSIPTYAGGLQGGVWNGGGGISTGNAITRIRMFTSAATTTRYAFTAGTNITIYGFG